MRPWLEFAGLGAALVAAPVGGCSDPAGPPTTGTLEVTTSTSGGPAGVSYSLEVDGSIRTTVAPDGHAAIAGLAAGTHRVTLLDLPPQCTSAAGDARPVEITPGATARLLFDITCSLAGSLRVITSISGDSLDPDGYLVVVEGITGRPIGTADTVVFDGLSPGDLRVSLDGVAANCALESVLPATVPIGAGGQTTLMVLVRCRAPGGGGVIQVVVTTSLINAGGIRSFSAVLDRLRSLSVPANSAASFTGVAAGSHSVRLVVPPYCAVGGFTRAPNPVGVVLPANGTAIARFSVLCIG